MKCERIRELMSAYIDNEINEVDKAKFEKHLAQCPTCKEEYELLLDVVNECSDIDEIDLPEDFREELHNKLLQAKKSKSRGLSDIIRRNKWKVYAGTTAAAAVLVLALSFNAINAPKPDTSVAQGTAPKLEMLNGAGEEPKQKSYDIAVAPSAPVMIPTTTAAQGNARDRDKITITYSEKITTGNNTDNYTVKGFADAAPNPVTTAAEAARKIIKNGNITLKVTDVQSRINEITAMAEKLGGYVDNSAVNDVADANLPAVPEGGVTKEKTTKLGTITIKVPANQFESSFQGILAMGKVENQNTSTNDITKEYMDLESRMNNLKIQEKTYQDLLAKTKNVEEALKVETEINRLRTEIDIMQGDLKRWNEQIEYSTIYVNLTEVKEAELEKVDTSSVWHRARQGLIGTLNDIKDGLAWFFVFLVSSLPYILILGAGSLLAVYWIRKINK